MTPAYDPLLIRIEQIIQKQNTREERLAEISQLLAEHVPAFDWVGFYLVDETRERTLLLGPYAGDPTEHTRIAFGEGICGQAADTEATFVIQDVDVVHPPRRGERMGTQRAEQPREQDTRYGAEESKQKKHDKDEY